MIVYRYDKNTKEYLGEYNAFIDPLETKLRGQEVFAIPAYCTTKEPFIPEIGSTIVFNGENWEQIEDHRGAIVFNKKTGKMFLITELGVIPDEYVLEKPVIISELKEEKAKEIEALYVEEIEKVISIGKLKGKAQDWVEFSKTLSSADMFKVIPVRQENDYTLVDEKELEEATRFLYIRSCLLPVRKKELVKELKGLKSKKQVLEFKVDFNIDEEMKKYIDLPVEELNEKMSEVTK